MTKVWSGYMIRIIAIFLAVAFSAQVSAQNLQMRPEQFVSKPWGWTGAQAQPPCAPATTTGTITLTLNGCSTPVNVATGGSPDYWQFTLTGNGTLALTGPTVGQVFRLEVAAGSNSLTLPTGIFVFPSGANTTFSGNSTLVCSVHDLTPTYWCPGGVVNSMVPLAPPWTAGTPTVGSVCPNGTTCVGPSINVTAGHSYMAVFGFCDGSCGGGSPGGRTATLAQSGTVAGVIGSCTNIKAAQNANNTTIVLFKCPVTTSGAVQTTASLSVSGGGGAAQVIAFDLAPAAVDDGTSTASSGASGSATFNTGSITLANEFVLNVADSVTNSSWTVGSGWNTILNLPGTGLSFLLQYKLLGPGVQACAFTAPGAWAGICAPSHM